MLVFKITKKTSTKLHKEYRRTTRATFEVADEDLGGQDLAPYTEASGRAGELGFMAFDVNGSRVLARILSVRQSDAGYVFMVRFGY